MHDNSLHTVRMLFVTSFLRESNHVKCDRDVKMYFVVIVLIHRINLKQCILFFKLIIGIY